MGNSKELFIKAFMEAEQISNTQFENKGLEDITFSDSFEKKMNKLLKKDKRISLSTRRNIRKGLLAAIIAIIVAFTGLMSISATRIPFVEFIKKFDKRNGMIEIQLDPYATPLVDTIETEYTLSYIPEGYTLDTYQKEDYSVFVIWKNDENEEIVFSQTILDSNWSIDTEHGYQEIVMNGYEAYLTDSSLVWRDDCYWFNLSVPQNFSEKIIKFAENICEKN